jgi:CelD/BcsL family acetyltransferase involved in cellulose biosynthesis
VRVERTPDPAEALEWLARLHGARWARHGLPGVLADEAVRRFHAEAAPALVAAGLARLWMLRIGDRVAAVHYGFTEPGRAAYYLGGFDPELAALSPGALLLRAAFEETMAAGARELDLLRGREPYKYRWGAQARVLRRRRVTPP